MLFECPGSQKFKHPYPETFKCHSCGNEVEIWSDEFEAICQNCKKVVTKSKDQNCLDWCKFARQCVGDEKYENYIKNRKKDKEA